MKEFSSDEIIKLLDALIGPTTAVGETNADNEILKNLEKLIDVMDWGIDQIEEASSTYGRPEYSMNRIGVEALNELKALAERLVR